MYIIISANEYEFCSESQCLDVTTGKYLTFENYEEYKNFILKSRIKKERRIEKQIVWQEKQKEKMIKKLEKEANKIEIDINKIQSKANNNREYTFYEKRQIKEYERELERIKKMID